MLGFTIPGLVINTLSPVNYKTTLKESELKALKERLDNFDFRMGTKEQYMEAESIMNILNGTLDNQADQMDLAGLFLELDKIKHRQTWRGQPSTFVNVLLKIVERNKGQTGGMNRNLPRRFVLPQRSALQPIRQMPLHGTMSAAEATQKQRFFRQNHNLKTRKIKESNKANAEENYGNVAPIKNNNMYNLINRPTHKKLWNNYFSSTKKQGGTRKKLPKSNTPEFRKQVINTIRSRINLTKTHKNMLIQRYMEAANAGLATPDEISALVGLTYLKHYTPRTLRRRK